MLIKIKGQDFTPEEVAVLARAGVLDIHTKNDPASTTPTATPLHGQYPGNSNQYGIFSNPGVRPETFSALPRVRSIWGAIPLQKSVYTNEKIRILTGQTAEGGTNATGFCGNPPAAGQLKSMEIVATFGDFYGKTQLNTVPLVGGLRDRADVPAEIINDQGQVNPFLPDITMALPDSQSQLRNELFTFGVSTERSFGKVVWSGNPATASASTRWGWIREFAGLERWVKTGYTDASTNVLAPAADSIVSTWNASVGSTVGGNNIVQTISDVWYGLQDRADRFNMQGIQWAIAMRGDQFRALLEVYACNYATYRCAGSASLPVQQDATEVRRFQLEMLNGRYLLIDGQAVPVMFTDGLDRQTIGNNNYNADMFFLPMSYAGLPLLRAEYFDMNNSYNAEFREFAGDDKRIINDGAWMIAKRSTGMCDEFHFAGRFRLIIDTPFLAARIDDIQYTFTAQQRDPYPGDSFYADGGVTYRS